MGQPKKRDPAAKKKHGSPKTTNRTWVPNLPLNEPHIYTTIFRFEAFDGQKLFYVDDVILMVGYRVSMGKKIMAKVRRLAGKPRQRAVTVDEFLKYSGFSENRVRDYLKAMQDLANLHKQLNRRKGDKPWEL